jgi:hypothetical protein
MNARYIEPRRTAGDDFNLIQAIYIYIYIFGQPIYIYIYTKNQNDQNDKYTYEGERKRGESIQIFGEFSTFSCCWV